MVRLIKDQLLPAEQACIGAPYVIREVDLYLPDCQARDQEWSCSITGSRTGTFWNINNVGR